MILNRRMLLILMGIALFMEALVIGPTPAVVQTIALLVFAALCPGLLMADLLVGRGDQRPIWLEFGLYGFAAGYALLTLEMLYLSYLPGELTRAHVLFASNLLLLGLFVLSWCKANQRLTTPASPLFMPLSTPWLIAAVASILVIGGLLRLPNLGYTEFQGDEARAMLRSAAVIQGFDEVLMLHKKGPVEILLPTVGYAVGQTTTEAAARLPFAVANLLGLLGIFLLGWAMISPVAGWSAAMLLAVEGYLIGFARIVQYQSIILLVTVLIVLILYRLYRSGRLQTGYLILAALFAVTGLLAHYEAAAVAIPGAFLLGLTLRRQGDWRRLIAPALLGGLLLASFYLLFLRHPNFGNTYTYLAENRIGGQLPYNHLQDFFMRTVLYNSTYHFVVIAGLLLLALLYLYTRNLTGAWRWIASALILIALWLVVTRPVLFGMGDIDWTVLPFALALGLAPFLPRQSTEERVLWLWFSSLFLVALFLIAKPRTHVYVFFMPWALLAGLTIERGWRWLAMAMRPRIALGIGLTVATFAILLFAGYTAQLFTIAQRETYRTWAENRPRGYWTPFVEPINSSLFGLPTRNGWKSLGILYADGELEGAYETNDFDEWTTYWYARGAEQCWRDHRYLVVGDHSEMKRKIKTAELLDAAAANHRLLANVTVNGQPRLEIYTKDAPTDLTTRTLSIETLGPEFDRRLSGPALPLDAPTVDPQYDEALDVLLGERIELAGYRLASRMVAPGDMIDLTLYWRAQSEIDERYTVFSQVIGPDNAMLGQLDAQPVCDRRPTDDWPVGEYIVDRYRIPIFPDAEPGVYPLFTGMYDREYERLPVFVVGEEAHRDAMPLGDITIVAPRD